MKKDRQEIVIAVLNGSLSPDYITIDELNEIESRVHAIIMDREIEKAFAQGKNVFNGIDNGVLN
jgi:hypothetical protein